MDFVVPKLASESRTIRFNKWTGRIAVVVGLMPDLVGIVIDLLGDDRIAAMVADFIPLRYRALFVAVVVFIVRRNIKLRYETTQPIAKGE